MLNQNIGLELNTKGYLVNFDAWNEDFAIKLAKENDLSLTGYHWLIINFLRDHHSEYGVAPDHREIIKKLGKQINPIALAMGNERVTNIIALGAFAGISHWCDYEILQQTISDGVPQRFLDLNLAAFVKGYELTSGQTDSIVTG